MNLNRQYNKYNKQHLTAKINNKCYMYNNCN